MFILDGSSLINWQYYGQMKAPAHMKKTASDAVMDFINKIKKSYGNPYIAVVLDYSRETTFRRALYPEYKAQRDETPMELKEEIKLLAQKCIQIGIPVFESPEFEADDYAGTFAKHYSPYETVILITKDQDYMQLVNNNCYVWLIKDEDKIAGLVEKYGAQPVQSFSKKIYAFTPEIVRLEYSVVPKNIPDLKGIMGDSSDNIPGVKGVGEKTAKALLEHYGNIDDMYLEIESIDENILKKAWKDNFKVNSSIYDKIKAQKDMAYLSRKLATIFCDIQLITG